MGPRVGVHDLSRKGKQFRHDPNIVFSSQAYKIIRKRANNIKDKLKSQI
jgi:hypothetical protein